MPRGGCAACSEPAIRPLEHEPRIGMIGLLGRAGRPSPRTACRRCAVAAVPDRARTRRSRGECRSPGPVPALHRWWARPGPSARRGAGGCARTGRSGRRRTWLPSRPRASRCRWMRRARPARDPAGEIHACDSRPARRGRTITRPTGPRTSPSPALRRGPTLARGSRGTPAHPPDARARASARYSPVAWPVRASPDRCRRAARPRTGRRGALAHGLPTDRG